MILIGLTGGVATGKSTVAKLFERCGAIVIDADKLAREVVQPDKPAWREIVRRFGTSVLNGDKTINRQTLGQIVFQNRTKLRQLERIIHPRVAREQARLTRQAARNDPHSVVIYDVPLLFEAGIDKRVDKTVVVTADLKTQIERLKKRNGLTRAEALRRIRNQMPLSLKRHRADYVLDGTKQPRRLASDVNQLFKDF
jgi:dephospho-CoA kinase